MTGSAWGRHPGDTELGAITVELRSVNGRGLTVKHRLPPELFGCERALEECIRARISRGTVFVTVALERAAADVERSVDTARFAAAAARLARLATDAGMAPPTVRDVLVVPGVLNTATSGRDVREGPTDEAPAALLAAMDAVLVDLVASREVEGRTLSKVVGELVRDLERGLAMIVLRAPSVVDRYRERLLQRVREFLEGHAARLESADIVQQVALFADKVDVTEEIERLRSHLSRAHAMLSAGGAIGRPL